MKKSLIVFIALLLMSGAYVIAKDADGPYVNASSTVTKEISPNYALISIAVNTESKDAKEAADENAKISNEVVTNIKAFLNEKKGETIKTTDYNLSPQYTYKDGKSNITGYKATNTVKIKIRDVQSVSAIIEEAVKSGATRVSGLKFGYDEESNICNELYAKATKNAYSQAQSVARALGSEVTGARSIDTSCSIDNPDSRYINYYMDGMVAAKAAGASNSAPPVEAGNVKVRASINGTFNIK